MNSILKRAFLLLLWATVPGYGGSELQEQALHWAGEPQAIKAAANLTADSLQLSRNMTIRNISRHITIPVKITHLNGQTFYDTNFKLDRFAWLIRENGSWLEKRVVNREFDLKICLLPTVVMPIKLGQ